MESGSPKVFVSHAAADYAEIVAPFLSLLRLGCDLQSSSLFCSSAPANIPNGNHFVTTILAELHSSDLTIAIVSPDYLKSQFCLAEVGVAQYRRIHQKHVSCFSLIVPPVRFADLDGVLYGVQSGKIESSHSLDELFQRIHEFGGQARLTNWNPQKELFLRHIAPVLHRRGVEEELGGGIVTVRRALVRPIFSWTYSFRLQVAFRNASMRAFAVENVTWEPKSNGAKGCDGWYALRLDGSVDEQKKMAVAPGQTFFVEIALDSAQDENAIRQMLDACTAGQLSMDVKADSHSIKIRRQF